MSFRRVRHLPGSLIGRCRLGDLDLMKPGLAAACVIYLITVRMGLGLTGLVLSCRSTALRWHGRPPVSSLSVAQVPCQPGRGAAAYWAAVAALAG